MRRKNNTRSSRPVVAIVQKNLAHYRVPFYEHLRPRLHADGVGLRFLYGLPTNARRLRRDTTTLPWAQPIRTIPIRVREHTLYWQSVGTHLRGVDLVVVEQASKLLLNYVLLARQALGGPRVAFWGHGRNLKAHEASGLGEALKAFTSTRVHWWFAYNAMSQRIVERLGFPPERITSVQNAIDTRRLSEHYRSLSPTDVDRVRRTLQLQGTNVGLFIGSMYPEKRLDFLVDACRQIRTEIPDFEMLWIGAGPDEGLVRDACAQHPWMRFVGPKFGLDRVPYFKLAKVLLMPGLVGLTILDAFSLETPLVTTAIPYHSPEIDYLIPNQNGVIVSPIDDPARYATAVARLLHDDERRERLIDGGRAAAEYYTVEEMADRFAEGVQHALAAR